MSLTAAQKFSLFEILEIPYGTTGNILSDDGLSRTQKTVADSWAAKIAVEDHLAALTADAETRLGLHIAEWDAIRYATARIEAGGVGGVGGATYDPNEKRREILKLVLVIVPFYRLHEQLGALSSGDDINIRVDR